MTRSRFDVVVVGSGPGGSVAAFVLAKGGARVALVDKARFPRDKACGDLVGPRGVAVLSQLGLEPWGADRHPTTAPPVRVSDMLVVGPSGRSVVLPSGEGIDFPGHGWAIPRHDFDAALRDAAIDAGALPVTGRVQHLRNTAAGDPGAVEGVELDDGTQLDAPVVIGADGATSVVGEQAGLVDPTRALWGFAVRSYLDEPVELPTIVIWEPARWRGFPGYGWIFPGPDGRANAGLGLGTLADRRAGATAVRQLPHFLADLRRLGLRKGSESGPRAARLGGWLKMGSVGTIPAAGGVLLVGDAAGLVNPLQGEGIAQAMTSGRAVAEAVLAGPARAAARYRSELARMHARYQRVAAALHVTMVGRPRVAAVAGRALTVPAVGRAVAGGWALYWNDLVDGAPPGRDRDVARAAGFIGRALTHRTRAARWFEQSAAR